MADERRLCDMVALALSCSLMASTAFAADEDAPAPPSCPACCQVAVEVAPRFGISINEDQWLFGGHLRTSLPCLGNLGFGTMLAVGVGGNFLSVRSSGRLDYMLWFDHAHTFGIYPSAGASVNFYTPVGRFASFCRRVDLEECSGYLIGTELGGGVRYRRLSIDAFVGFGGLPALTIMLAMSFPQTGPEAP